MPEGLQDAWYIVIADDEETMREVIVLSLESLTFEGKPVVTLQAENGSEAIKLLRSYPETSIVFLDVVMETPNDGLETAGKIRRQLGMSEIRIILNTAQGSSLPRLDALRQEGVNDFQYKSELSVIRLQALVLSNLRNYQDLIRLKRAEVLSSRIIQTSSRIQAAATLSELTGAVMSGFGFLAAAIAPRRPYPQPDGFLAKIYQNSLRLLAGIGTYEHRGEEKELELTEDEDRDRLEIYLEKKRCVWAPEYILYPFATAAGDQLLVYVKPRGVWGEDILNNARVYFSRVPAAFDRLQLIGSLRQRTEELSKALREREVLLKEIHHRVKNNLQIISSLLSLDSEQDTDLARDRIHSMALVHEQLYHSRHDAEVDLSNYLDNLVRDLAQAFHLGENLQVRHVAEEVMVPFDKAIPIGLLVNELVTNAAKYAYPEGGAGAIKVSLEPGHPMRIRIEDQGIGKRSIGSGGGIQLAELLVNQLKGELRTLEGDGTGYEAIIP